MSLSSRDVAVEVALAVAHGDFADQALARALATSRLAGAPAARATALAYHTVRLLGRCDAVLRPLVTRPLGHLHATLLAVLRVGACELLWMERTLAPAAVDDLVGIAKRRGHTGLAKVANAVLRRIAGGADDLRRPPDCLDGLDWLIDWASLPRFLAERWTARFGPESARALAEAALAEPTVCLRANRLRCDRDQLAEALRAAGHATEPSDVAPDGLRLTGAVGRVDDLPGYADGWFSVQDEGAQLVAPLCTPRPGARVLDMCAAPGGKAVHLAELMGDQGLVAAVDRNERRLRRLEDTIRRLRLGCLEPSAADARTLADSMEPFDVVLLDAPCTGTGTLARRPDLRWRLDGAGLRRAADQQAELLEAAARLVRPGGVLVYATCSLEPEENEAQMELLAVRCPELIPDGAVPEPPPGWDQDRAAVTLAPVAGRSDGFFMARRRRTA